MSSNRNIEWTEATWNPVAGCAPVSPGCHNCYAATMAARLEAMGKADYQPVEQDAPGSASTLADPIGEPPHKRSVPLTVLKGGKRWFSGAIRLLPHKLDVPMKWRKPRRIFVNSMSDLFHRDVPFEFIDKVFAIMALCPQHTFQVLTKRPERMAEYTTTKDRKYAIHAAMERLCSTLDDGTIPAKLEPLNGRKFLVPRKTWAQAPAFPSGLAYPLPNVWLGTSVENQQAADERIPHLLRCPAAVRFLSCEPLLGPVNLRSLTGCTRSAGECNCFPAGIHWVIVGGESGPNARPCDVAWIRSIVRQCKAAGVPCFVEQLGAKPYDSSMTQTTCHGKVHYTQPADHPRAQEHRDQIAAGSAVGYAVVPMELRLHDRKGGDINEWPMDLRVREYPSVKA